MLAAELPVPGHGAGEARDAIDRILARREFADEPRSLLQRGQDWVLERLDRLADEVLGSGQGSVFAWVVVAVLVAAAVFFAVRLTRELRRDPGLAVRTTPSPRRPAADWWADAEANEAAGDWRAALRCRWRGLVADLAARGVVDEVPGRTAGEYRRAVGETAPRAADDFAGATSLFEAAWYGNRRTGPDEAARFRAHSDRVLEGAGR